MKLNLRNKLLAAFATVLALTVIVGWAGISEASKISQNAEDIANDQLVGALAISRIAQDTMLTRAKVLAHILTDDEAKKAQIEEEIAALDAAIDEGIQGWREADIDGHESAAIDSLAQSWASFKEGRDTLTVPASRAGDTEEAVGYATGEVGQRFNAVVEALDKARANQREAADAAIRDNAAAYSTAQWLIVGATAVAMLLSMGLGFFLSRSIADPAKQMVKAAEEIARVDLANLAAATAALANGDLTQTVTFRTQTLAVKSKDEIGDLGRAFNEMIARLQEAGTSFSEMTANLRGLIGQLANNADSVGAASEQLASAAQQSGQATSQIASTIQQVAKGITQQSESVTRTASSVEQMKRAIEGVAKGAQEQASAVGKASEYTTQITTAIHQVTSNAKAVTQASNEAANAARDGAKTVEETINGMESIKAKVGVSADKVKEMGQRSEQIGAIVETIDDIASQTNLLALNAAIEAARAGEHGKGFAVVADEVRKLAERASAATKEIGALIKGIQHTMSEATAAMDEGAREVAVGSVKAHESGRALANILQAAEAVSKQAEAALEATQRMTRSSNELVTAMDSVSAVVEENTAATEEMAAGSSEVAESVESIAAVSEENSAAVEEVSASTEEMSAQVSEVTASAQSLSALAQALQDAVSQFKLNAGDDGRAGGEGRREAKNHGRAKSSVAAPHQLPLAVPIKASGNGNGHRYEDLPMR